MNKSSSFYSEAYYEDARKNAHIKKPVYRQRNKQLYDQEHELQILKCQMSRYYEMISKQFFIMKAKVIKGSDEYNETSKDYIAKINDKIKYFHEHLMCDQYLTPKQFRKAESQKLVKQEEGSVKSHSSFDMHDQNLQSQSRKQKEEDCPRRLDTCNHCPIFIEEYEVNFHKTPTVISKQSSYWDKLNGNQKLAKFRKHIEQNLKILKYELQTKCQFVRQCRRPMRPQRFEVDYDYI